MPLSRSSVLHYWSARYGAIPVIGGTPVHSRNSAARWFDQQGVLQSAIVNTPRFEWATIAGERRQVMRLEASVTNAWTYSEDIDAAWAKSDCSIASNVALAPDGTLTADKLVENTVNNAHQISRAGGGGTANTVQTFSFFAKRAERSVITILTRTLAGTVFESRVDLTTATVTTVAAGLTVRVLAVGGDWYRIAVSYNSGSGASSLAAFLETYNGSRAYLGDGSSGVYLWGTQWETDKASASSYMATTASTASRSADSHYWDFVHAPQAKMLYLRFNDRGTAVIASARLLAISDATEAVARLLLYNSSASYTLHHQTSGGTVTASVPVGAVGDTVELLCVLNVDGSVAIYSSINEAAVASNGPSAALALASTWSGQRLWLNSGGASNPGLADFSEVKIVKYADVAGATAADRMAELRAFELTAAGEVIS